MFGRPRCGGQKGICAGCTEYRRDDRARGDGDWAALEVVCAGHDGQVLVDCQAGVDQVIERISGFAAPCAFLRQKRAR